MRLGTADSLHLGQPFLLHPTGKPRAVLEELTDGRLIPCGPWFKQNKRIDSRRPLEFRAYVVIHGRKTAGVADAFERLEIQLGQVDAVPVEAPGKLLHAIRNGAKTCTIRKIHQLAPVEMRILKD